MRIGMVGLGKMGANMAARLVEGGHEVVGFDLDAASVAEAAADGVEGATSIDDLVGRLDPPRVVWLMVPAGPPVDAVLSGLVPLLGPDDVVVDGGNSYYRDTRRRAATCAEVGCHLVDVGVSGGVWGRTEGYSLMVGGEPAVVERLRTVFETLAPDSELGWGHVGPTGAGHFVKMVHNGIEYGLMQAYGEGFAIMEAKEEFDLDLAQVAAIWQHGSVVRSWLLDLTRVALEGNPGLEGIAPYVPDSGEGRWTVFEAIDLDVAAPVIALSLMQRIESRDELGFSDRLLAALRHQFGGHAVKTEDGGPRPGR